VPHDPHTLADLRSMRVDELETLFGHEARIGVPRGCHRGHFLAWLDPPPAQRKRWRWPQRVGFQWTPFGVDFDRGLWFFFHPAVAIGRFEPSVEPSRWRETEAVVLRYEGSRLPFWFRRILYDEVKPLSEGLVLGIGGSNEGRGWGDHFFFALELVDRQPGR